MSFITITKNSSEREKKTFPFSAAKKMDSYLFFYCRHELFSSSLTSSALALILLKMTMSQSLKSLFERFFSFFCSSSNTSKFTG